MVIDQLGNTFPVKKYSRVVCLVPSLTELLYELELNERVVGITKFCVHPTKWFHSKTRVGGTKNVNFNKIYALQPDLIIANKEENTQEIVVELQKHYPVYVSNINNLENNNQVIHDFGMLFSAEKQAKRLVDEINESFSKLPKLPQFTAVYLIWVDPILAAGANTFIHFMLQAAGFQNQITQARYPEINIEYLKQNPPKVLLLSSEPYPFKQKHVAYFKKELPHTHIELVDGELFSWYGARIKHSAAYFLELIALIFSKI